MANKKKTFNLGAVTEAVTFSIDEDEFEAIPVNRLPAGALSTYFNAINDSKIFEAQEIFFKAVLTEASYKLFSDRMVSTEKPITFTLLTDIAAWLLGEVYLQGEATEESKSS